MGIQQILLLRSSVILQMKEYLARLPDEILRLIYLAKDISEQKGFKSYLIGGFVRDLMLGVSNLDLDICVEGEGIKFAQLLCEKLYAKLITHKRFGTATIIIKPHLKIDIATARKEFYPEPAALPVVTSGSLKDDLARRDFTINAMALGITADEFGRPVDLFGGQEDLGDKKIRILHKLSFIDDPTRILRAIRFEQRYDFHIEADTLLHLKQAVRIKMIDKVQPQRLRDELILMLKEKSPFGCIQRLEGLTGLDFVNKNLRFSPKSRRIFKSVKVHMEWFLCDHHHRRHLDNWLIYFMALLEPLSLHQIKSVCNKFVFRKGDEKRIITYKERCNRCIRQLSKKVIKPSMIFKMLEPLSYEVIILILAKSSNKNLKVYIRDFLSLHHGTAISVSGHDLRMLGLKPGPAYQRIFKAVLNAKLDGLVSTKEEELNYVKKMLRIK